ncbi:J domain-containing protein [Streptomyces sp. NPDC055287]
MNAVAGQEPSGRRHGHYAVLGVRPTASAAQITSAYRGVARAPHRDANPGGPATDGRFTEVVAARATLRDPVLRAAYDSRRGPRGPDGPGSRDAPAGARDTWSPRAARVTVEVTVHPAPPRHAPPLWAGPTRGRPAYEAPGPPGPHPATGWDLVRKWIAG